MNRYGLIGYPLSHSFSEGYFAQKFKNENIQNAIYQNFPLENITQFQNLINDYPDLTGLNVTIPYKTAVIPYLDELDKTARKISAVNTIRFVRDENNVKLIGYNTDVYGFEQSIKPLLDISHKSALILGTGGASKAIFFILHKLGLACSYVSRKQGDNIYKTYEELTDEDIDDFQVIVNTSPLGMYPDIDSFPKIPYEAITTGHILYDLIYNPEETLFLNKGKLKGAQTKNGLEMLHLQAEKAWKIWNII